MKIGALLVRLRKEKELSEKDLGGLIKMSDAYINLLENDKRTPSLQTLIKLAAALEVHPTFFFRRPFPLRVLFPIGRSPQLRSRSLFIN